MVFNGNDLERVDGVQITEGEALRLEGRGVFDGDFTGLVLSHSAFDDGLIAKVQFDGIVGLETLDFVHGDGDFSKHVGLENHLAVIHGHDAAPEPVAVCH